MKKIALFGGSGKTGQEFLKLALENGDSLKALARTPSKISQQSPKLEVIQGDVLNSTDVEKVVEGTDLVVSLFGQVKGSPKDLQTRGTTNIISAMKKYGLNRIISLSGGGLPFEEKDQPKFPDKLIRGIMKLAVPHILKDAQDHFELLQASGLDWIIVRGPRLLDGPPRGEYRVGWVGVNASTSVRRADLADFILKEVHNQQFSHSMPFVSY